MKIFRDATKLENKENTLCVLGNFDGIHFGHKQLILTAKEIAKQQNLKLAIMTFEPHPKVFFNLQYNIRITPIKNKLIHFKELGVDIIILQRFNKKFAELEAEYFLTEILLNKLNASHIVIGHDFIFGRKRQGNSAFLKLAAEKYGFGLTQILPAKSEKHNLIFSSSSIRKFIRNGNVKYAKELMGRNYAISGRVIKGKKIGGMLGYNTANILLKDFIRPKFGVYAIRADIEGKIYEGVANIGVRPTISNEDQELLEIHFFEFDQNIYGKYVRVELIDFIRAEKKFASLEELSKKIAEDCKNAKAILNVKSND